MSGPARRSARPELRLPSRSDTLQLLRAALREDIGTGDATSRRVIPSARAIQARVLARSEGILAGVEIARRLFLAHDPSLSCRVLRADGSRVRDGEAVLGIKGRARTIFEAERAALNLLGHLSGIATLTRAFVERVRGTRTVILDTRKTLPGLRLLEKYAVAAGGGTNHRLRLDDAVLIKTNHLRALAESAGASRVHWIQPAIQRARWALPQLFVQIEVTDMAEYEAALAAEPDAMLLDNWRIADVRRAVALRKRYAAAGTRPPLLEVSGGVTLRNARRIAQSGVERISIGRLTHSAEALDVSLRVI